MDGFSFLAVVGSLSFPVPWDFSPISTARLHPYPTLLTELLSVFFWIFSQRKLAGKALGGFPGGLLWSLWDGLAT